MPLRSRRGKRPKMWATKSKDIALPPFGLAKPYKLTNLSGMIWFRRLLLGFLVLLSTLTLGLVWFTYQQGGESSKVESNRNYTILRDSLGVPTLQSDNWESVIEAQGYAVASDRLFQMDLMRRSASGRLSEWFGDHPSAIQWDRGRRMEDWQSTAEDAVKILQLDNLKWCEAYAKGVNYFIDTHPWKWGIEYVVLMRPPEKWSCTDSILVFLSMVDDLSRTAEREVVTTPWKKHLTQEWFDFLFPQDHPWNKPLFGQNPNRLKVPHPLPSSNPTIESFSISHDAFFPGSNAWFWSGKTGAFLANDPHLNYTVPQLWYANRLRIDSKQWVVGASLPGIPGVVLGRNAYLSWAFTNAAEDVDDLLEEELSPDGNQYVSEVRAGKKVFKSIQKKDFEIRIRGAESVNGVAQFTHRGPLLNFAELGKDKWFSRRWLGFTPDRLNLPMAELNRASNWKEINKAIDGFRAPAQNILIADNKGNVGYRMSGTGVLKKGPALYTVPALQNDWLGFAPASERKRLWLTRKKDSPQWLSTANQRIYVGNIPQYWSSDLRQSRIQEVLASSPSHTQETMAALQLDTQSRYLKLFVDWLAKSSTSPAPEIQKLCQKFSAWNGDLKSEVATAMLAIEAHRVFTQILFSQIRQHLLPTSAQKNDYLWKDQNAWLVYLVEHPESMKSFGFNPNQLAHAILDSVTKPKTTIEPYPQQNAWRAQHPMAASVPLLGSWLKIDEHPQLGFDGVVRVEKPRQGASVRVIWNIDAPLESTWVFPNGQSGHVASSHYKDFRKLWFEEKSAKVFPTELKWEFPDSL